MGRLIPAVEVRQTGDQVGRPEGTVVVEGEIGIGARLGEGVGAAAEELPQHRQRHPCQGHASDQSVYAHVMSPLH